MKNIFSAIWAESLKIYRSKMLWITILAFAFIPSMIGVLMFVVKNPEFSRKLGMIGTKAAMLRFGSVDWQIYFGLLNQIIAGVGLIGFTFVASWVFGREYSDRTVKDLLALPTPRSSIVLSKFIVVAIWCVLLSFILIAFGLIVGGMIKFPGWSSEIAFHCVHIFIITSLLTILLCTPVAFFASYGRGYLPAIGFAILTLIITQFIGLVGLGPYFPWAIPALYSGTTGVESAQLGVVSYIILFLTSIFGLIGTLAWWHYADQY
ncbi:MAG TPA: bacitracin ABC transporter permease [Candidatus Atribacteria bacterium]|nr:bacitracin ABC transporter permease [Candidatus Atribacteria bacterium]